MSNPEQQKPCVFLDRDGIINRSPGSGWVERPEDFHILPGFPEVLRLIRQRGYESVVITNQRGVSLGKLSEADLRAIHDKLLATLRAEGLDLLDIYVCIHERGHPDRKPGPGMILKAAEQHGLDLSRSWMIGDQESDVEAGRNAGCKTIRVAENIEHTAADYHLNSMSELVSFLQLHLPEMAKSP